MSLSICAGVGASGSPRHDVMALKCLAIRYFVCTTIGSTNSKSVGNCVCPRVDSSAVPDFALPLREEDVDPDPLRQFAAWYKDAARAGLREPGAMAVATSTAEGAPSVRMVLLKGYDERGFVFYTNYNSRKGRELEANPRAALLFYWDPLGRQVRIEGHTERTSAAGVRILRP